MFFCCFEHARFFGSFICSLPLKHFEIPINRNGLFWGLSLVSSEVLHVLFLPKLIYFLTWCSFCRGLFIWLTWYFTMFFFYWQWGITWCRNLVYIYTWFIYLMMFFFYLQWGITWCRITWWGQHEHHTFKGLSASITTYCPCSWYVLINNIYACMYGRNY